MPCCRTRGYLPSRDLSERLEGSERSAACGGGPIARRAVDIVLAIGGPETATLIRKRQWRPSEYGEWLYRLAERLFQPALCMGGPFNFKGFPPSGERNSAELAVF